MKVVIRFEDYLDNEWQNKISLPCSCLQPKRETVEPEKYVDIIRDNIDLIHKSIKNRSGDGCIYIGSKLLYGFTGRVLIMVHGEMRRGTHSTSGFPDRSCSNFTTCVVV